MVAYGSCSCNGAESRYNNFEGELLAAVYFVRLWRQYLYGERFVLESDHPEATTVDPHKHKADGQIGQVGPYA